MSWSRSSSASMARVASARAVARSAHAAIARAASARAAAHMAAFSACASARAADFDWGEHGVIGRAVGAAACASCASACVFALCSFCFSLLRRWCPWELILDGPSKGTCAGSTSLELTWGRGSTGRLLAFRALVSVGLPLGLLPAGRCCRCPRRSPRLRLRLPSEFFSVKESPRHHLVELGLGRSRARGACPPFCKKLLV